MGLIGIAYGQTIGYLRYDTVKIMKNGGRGSLDVTGAVRFTGLLAKSAGTDSVVVRDVNGYLGTVAKTSVAGSGWLLAGNAGTTAGTDFVGTTDAVDVVLKRNNIEGLRITNRQIDFNNGYFGKTENDSTGILFKTHVNNTKQRFLHTFRLPGTDGDNLFMGIQAGNFTMTGSSGSQGSYNTGIGNAALFSNTTGQRNTALGTYGLQNNTTGFNNTAIGSYAGIANTTGFGNTGLGVRALNNTTTGYQNVAVGVDALATNTTGYYNVGVGLDALYLQTTGYHNTALGDCTLVYNTTGYGIVGVGFKTLNDHLTGSYNTAVGDSTAQGIVSGTNNTILGARVSGLSSTLNNNIIITNGTGNRLFGINVDSSGNVGLGTISPAVKLHVYTSGISGSVTSSYFESVGATTTNIAARLKATNAVNNIALAVDNGEGSVGIGTLTPAAILHTVGTVRLANTGTASTDTTTYKPVGISSLGDIIPMTAWPQQVTPTSTTTFENKNIQLTIVTKTASDTLELTDAGKDIEMNVGSGNSLSVPANADVAFPVGTQIIITQLGTGQTTIVALSGVTIRSSGGKLKITDQYSGATLIKRGTNEWVLFGNLSL